MISYADRVFAAGTTTSGKSTLLNYLFVQYRVRRVFIDSKAEFSIAGAPVSRLRALDEAQARREVDAIDWTQPIIHVRHSWLGKPGSREQLTALFERIAELPEPVKTTIHEATAVSSAHWWPPGLLEEAVAGARKGHGLDSASQRPRFILKNLISEATHVFLFPPLDEDDLVESRRGVPFLRPRVALEASETLPHYGYIYANRAAREWYLGDPVPDYLRADVAKVICHHPDGGAAPRRSDAAAQRLADSEDGGAESAP